MLYHATLLTYKNLDSKRILVSDKLITISNICECTKNSVAHCMSVATLNQWALGRSLVSK